MNVIRLQPLEADGPGELAHAVLEGLIEDFRRPAFRVEFAAAMLATLPCARARLPILPSLLVAVAAGKAARWAYESAEEIKSKLSRGDETRGV